MLVEAELLTQGSLGAVRPSKHAGLPCGGLGPEVADGEAGLKTQVCLGHRGLGAAAG